MENITLKDPHNRRYVEENIDKSIICIDSDLNGENGIISKEDLKLKMEGVIRLRNKIIETLIGVLK